MSSVTHIGKRGSFFAVDDVEELSSPSFVVLNKRADGACRHHVVVVFSTRIAKRRS